MGVVIRIPASFAGNAEGLLHGRELLRHLVLDEDGELVVPGDEDEDVMEIEGLVAPGYHLVLAPFEVDGLVELIDQPAVRWSSRSR